MRYVALLRGINVTGNNMIKMETLRATFESLGFKNVKSYINSGNIAFDARKAGDLALAKKIGAAIEKDIGKQISVMFREQGYITKILAADPFAGKYESHKQMHVLFMNEPMSADKVKALLAQQTDREKFIVKGTEIFALLLDGVAESMLGKGFIERKLKVTYTGRNWRTVGKVGEL